MQTHQIDSVHKYGIRTEFQCQKHQHSDTHSLHHYRQCETLHVGDLATAMAFLGWPGDGVLAFFKILISRPLYYASVSVCMHGSWRQEYRYNHEIEFEVVISSK